MLETILEHIHNYFVRYVNRGGFTISSGALDVDFLLPGQYFRICGSILNDGVYQYPVSELQDETFTGEIWALAIPRPVLELAAEIGSWVEQNPNTGKTSESFGGYSYSKATGKDGAPVSWTDVFRARLNPWRKLA